MRVIGVDPGLRHTGWGVVEFKNNKMFYVKDGSISPSHKLEDGKRLLEIKLQLQKSKLTIYLKIAKILKNVSTPINTQLL